LGETLDAAPHAGLAQGRTTDAKPTSAYAAAVNEMSDADECALSRDIRRLYVLLRDLWGRHSHWRRVPLLVFPNRALRRDAVWCPLSEACWMSSFGSAGMRDSATPSFPTYRYARPAPRCWVRCTRRPGSELQRRSHWSGRSRRGGLEADEPWPPARKNPLQAHRIIIRLWGSLTLIARPVRRAGQRRWCGMGPIASRRWRRCSG
jgi:hypothetical protein